MTERVHALWNPFGNVRPALGPQLERPRLLVMRSLGIPPTVEQRRTR